MLSGEAVNTNFKASSMTWPNINSQTPTVEVNMLIQDHQGDTKLRECLKNKKRKKKDYR